jgi:hypothetical protein
MKRFVVVVVATAGMGLGLSGPASAAGAASDASCTGQFFSSHAGLAAEHTEPRNVGEFISATARQLGSEFGSTISSARNLPREDCGL